MTTATLERGGCDDAVCSGMCAARYESFSSDDAYRVFEWIAMRHAYLHKQLREQKLRRSKLPDGEERQEVGREIRSIIGAMMELRDAGRVMLGLNADDRDDNPFCQRDDDF